MFKVNRSWGTALKLYCKLCTNLVKIVKEESKTEKADCSASTPGTDYSVVTTCIIVTVAAPDSSSVPGDILYTVYSVHVQCILYSTTQYTVHAVLLLSASLCTQYLRRQSAQWCRRPSGGAQDVFDQRTLRPRPRPMMVAFYFILKYTVIPWLMVYIVMHCQHIYDYYNCLLLYSIFGIVT